MAYTGDTNVRFIIKERSDVISGITFPNVYAGGALCTQVQPSHTLSQLFIILKVLLFLLFKN